MFDIGFPELMLVAIIALLVMGPQRLPEAMRTVGLWWGRLSRSFNALRTEIEREVGMDEIRRQIYNESIIADLERARREVTEVKDETRALWHDAVHGGGGGDDLDSYQADGQTPAPGVGDDAAPVAAQAQHPGADSAAQQPQMTPLSARPATSRAEALARHTSDDGEQPAS